MTKRKNRPMNLSAAREMVDDDLPDGAYWAIVHEIAGAEYGTVWDELEEEPTYYDIDENVQTPKEKKHQCSQCDKKFVSKSAKKKHLQDMRKNGTHVEGK
jgi:hypothetical protein